MEYKLKKGSSVDESELTLTQNVTRIALQTVKERCCLLQIRINALEKENLQLNAQCGQANKSKGSETDAEKLRETVSQLTREKSQLAQHVLLVSDENKKLWTRLSHLSEELPKRIEYPVPNLARSQTFTYPSNFKRINEIEENGKEIKNSLEEMSLKLIDSFLIEKSEYVDQYEQMVEMQMGESKSPTGNGNVDATTCNNDSLAEIKKQLEKMNEIKRAAIQQQIHLKKYMTHLDLQTEKSLCPTCNKLGNPTVESSREEVQNDSIKDVSDVFDQSANSPWHKQIVKENESKKCIPVGKICPMCGVRFQFLPFQEFELHVESHFITEDGAASLQDNSFQDVNSINTNFN